MTVPKVVRPFRVIVFEEGDWLCAHVLEYDLAAQAKSLDELRVELARLLACHIAASLENGQEPFAGLRPAPEKFWQMFRHARVPLPSERFSLEVTSLTSPITVDPPEIRVATAAAA